MIDGQLVQEILRTNKIKNPTNRDLYCACSSTYDPFGIGRTGLSPASTFGLYYVNNNLSNFSLVNSVKYMWSKYVTRRLAVQVAQAWNFGWGNAMKKVYGVSVVNTLVFRDSLKTEYYVDAKQHKKYVNGLYKLLKNKKFVKEFHGKAQTKLETILQKTKKKFTRDLSKLSNTELLDLYVNFVLQNMEQFYIRMWTVFNINEPLVDILKNNLEKKYNDSAVINNSLLKLSSLVVPNDALNERIDLLRIVIKKKLLSYSQYKILLERHTKKYRHIPLFDFDHEPYSYSHFFEQAERLKNPKEELSSLMESLKNTKKEIERVISEIKPDKNFGGLITFLQENVFLRDYRDMIRQKYNLELKKFYNEIGKRLGLTVEEVAVLTNNEIIQYLKNGSQFPYREVAKRGESFLLIQKGDTAMIYSGDMAIEKFKKELGENNNLDNGELTGIVGSKGKVKGSVILVFTNKDLTKVKDGDIMVAAMTRQDFVPAIKKCAALITDEGSVICHAAIIAREFKIPCIVNTKIGTQILKDGDIVEVDGEKGIVKKICG